MPRLALHTLSFASLVFTSATALSETKLPQKFQFIAQEASGSPIAGAKISGEASNKTRSNTVWAQEKLTTSTFECTTDDGGVCSIEIPLIRYEYWARNTFEVIGKITSVTLSNGSSLIFDTEPVILAAEQATANSLPIKRYSVSVSGELAKLKVADGKVVARSTPTKLPSLDEVAQRISRTGEDDNLETDIKFSTLRVRTFWDPTPEKSQEMPFIRAWLDKKTGAKTFQIYVVTKYSSESGFYGYNKATLETDAGPESAAVNQIDKDVKCSAKDTCDYAETLGFEISEALLQTSVKKYESKPNDAWRFRIHSRAGRALTLSIPVAEIAGLMLKIDRTQLPKKP